MGNFDTAINNDPQRILKEDLISVLAQVGTDLPIVGQTQIMDLGEIVNFEEELILSDNFIQKNKNISSPIDGPLASPADPGLSIGNTTPKLDQAFGAKGFPFKKDPIQKQMGVKGDFDITNNRLMNSLVTRKLLSNASSGISFKVDFSSETFAPKETQTITDYIPLQIGCLLSIADGSASPFKNFNINQQYINSNVINPDELADFWFKHQNIVRVEYLAGFEDYTEMNFLKNKTNPYSLGEKIEITERNVKKPVWQDLDLGLAATLTQSGQALFCKLTRYDNGDFINHNLVKNLDMPIINSYFLLS